MKKFAKRLVNLSLGLSSALIVGCAGMKLKPFEAGVTLPYSESCFFVNVLTKEEKEFPKAVCEKIKKKGVILTSDSWKILRKNIQDNCQVQQCKQIVGQFDQLFLVVDKNLQLIPWD